MHRSGKSWGCPINISLSNRKLDRADLTRLGHNRLKVPLLGANCIAIAWRRPWLEVKCGRSKEATKFG